ncbi:MAG: YHS domain-containing protein, partial [Planctomycetales bacterium]|nr:YHS domain-containing protein [Planctomycetales bacterium]
MCGMRVDPDSSLHNAYDGQHFYFCSRSCLENFSKSPGAAPHLAKARRAATEPTAHAEHSPPPPCCHENDRAGRPDATSKNIGDSQELGGGTIYTCPMHPEVEEPTPGPCPICGMDLEPLMPQQEETPEEIAEYTMMARRFWGGLALGLPVFLLAMLPMLGVPVHQWIPEKIAGWIQFLLCTPVVLWAGWPLYQRAWRSIVSMNLNMFTL